MKKLILTLLVAASTYCSQAQNELTADPNHSRVAFTIDHLGVTEVTGQFNTYEINFASSKPNLSDASFDVTIQVKSIDTNVDMRDKHLLSEDFFDVGKYDKIVFKSTGVKLVSGNKYKVTGELVMHGITKTVTMDMVYKGKAKNPAADNAEVTGIQVTGVVKRSDFNLGPKYPAPMLSDAVTLKFDGEFIKRKK